MSHSSEDVERRIDCTKIKIEYTPKNIMIEADRERTIQVISNLLSNALKFTMQGTIYVSEENKGGQVTVSIKDTGTGIDSEIMARLFTKFTSKSQTGTGLGLFLSKSIIEAHGGKISAENNTDANGSSFTFSLPLGA